MLFELFSKTVRTIDCSSANYDIEKELQQLSKTFEHIKAINQSLDDRLDTMLFDEDSSYWQILEELDVPK